MAGKVSIRRDVLSKGVFSGDYAPRDTGALSACHNMMAVSEGLSSPPEFSNYYTTQQLNNMGVSVSWPYPQLFIDSNVILAGQSSVWVDGALVATVGSNDLWHVVNEHGLLIMTNGKYVVYRKGSYYYTNDSPSVSSVCFHRGRVLYGSPVGQFVSFGQLPVNSVAWSSIGAGDALFPWTGEDYPDGMETVITNGMIMLPCSGEVKVIKPIGDLVAVYCSDKIILLRLVDSLVPTYGIFGVYDIGVSGRGAVGGDLLEHLFVSNSGELFKMLPDGRVERLGFRRLFALKTVVVAKDSATGRYYLSTSTAGYVLSLGGLTSLDWRVVSSVGPDVGMKIDVANPVNKAQVKTSGMMFDSMTMKTLRGLEIMLFSENKTKPTVSSVVFYRNDMLGDFTSSSAASGLTPDFYVTGREFYLSIEISPYSSILLEGISIDIAEEAVERRGV